MVIVVAAVMLPTLDLSLSGFLLAVLSGSIASGLGYALWYTALPGMTAIQAAVVQVTVPPLASLGGVVLLSEPITFRIVVASIMILGGVVIAVASRDDRRSPETTC